MAINSNISTSSRKKQKPDEFILVAIDGTWSRKEYNINGNISFTKRFYEQMAVPTPQKYYHDGPESGLGFDAAAIERNAWAWLSGAIKQKPDAKIVMVGHSRGGRSVTLLAHELKARKKDVWYLGLFDAVDRAFDFKFGSSTVPSNVIHFRHAIRSSNLGSRTSFGNTATEFERPSNNYDAREFIASHGAIGGAPPHECSNDWKRSFVYADWCNRKLSADKNSWGGLKAWLYILFAAKSVGVPV